MRPPDANGIQLPDGFTSRIVARSGEAVQGSDYVWHTAPDGGATFAAPDDGWIYVSNSEVGGGGGGAGALRFTADGEIAGGHPILTGTTRNCAGGPTPWNTWLSCEEFDGGRVWECDPFGGEDAVVRPAMGVFAHEAAAVDPVNKRIYLTEDHPQSAFYRFTPMNYPDISSGALEAARVAKDGSTTWQQVADPAATNNATRNQTDSTNFNGAEGAFFDAGIVYFTTKGDDRVWAYDTRSDRLSLFYAAKAVRGGVLSGVDNVAVSSHSGDVFVAEDGGDLDLVLITPNAVASMFLKVTGRAHRTSEITGPAMDPSGHRLYFSSQRGFRHGITYEVRGPFRTTRSQTATPGPTSSVPALPVVPERDSSPAPEIGAIAAGAAAVAAGALAWRHRSRRD